MKLEKAIKRTTSYPTKESIKPILLSLSVAIALSSCTPPITKKVSTTGNEPNTPIDESKKDEVSVPPQIAGGMPPYIPPTDSNNSKTSSNFKKKLINK